MALKNSAQTTKATARRRAEPDPAKVEGRYVRALVAMKRAETRLARSATKWNKLRLAVRRYEAQLDKLDQE